MSEEGKAFPFNESSIFLAKDATDMWQYGTGRPRARTPRWARKTGSESFLPGSWKPT